MSETTGWCTFVGVVHVSTIGSFDAASYLFVWAKQEETNLFFSSFQFLIF